MVTLRQAYKDSVSQNEDIMKMVSCQHTQAVAFYNTEKFYVVGFKGRRAAKNDFYKLCGSLQDVQNAAREFIEKEGQIHKEKLALAEQQTNCFTVGDLLVSRWGSDQINIDFYQVIKTTPKSIEFQKLKSEKSYSDVMHGKCIPLPGQFAENSKPIVRRVTDDYVFINDYSIARKLKETSVLPTGTKVYKGQSWSATA